MVDEPNPTPAPAPTEPLGNSTESRNPDGSLKNTQAPEPTPEPKATTEPEPKAPEPPPPKYADFKAPEGYELNAELIEKATPIFRELGLNQDAAQRLVDFYGEAALQAENAPYEAYEAMRADWRKEIIADRELGNGKDGLHANVQKNVSAAIDSLPADLQQPFKDAMTATGAGDNPAFIRAFNALGAKLGEGTLVTGRGPSPAGQQPTGRPQSAAQALFPSLPSAR